MMISITSMAATALTTNQEFLNANDLITRYTTLTQSTMRDLYANFVSDHVYLVHQMTQDNMGYTPYPADSWQSWSNLRKEKKEQTLVAKNKVKVQKTTVDPSDPKKKVKVEGEYEEKDKRLRKTTTFNAPGKSALACLAACLTHEAVMASTKITKTDITSIKNVIMENAVENCEYAVSPLMFTVCDKYDDDVIRETFVDIHGPLRSKLEQAVDKHVKDSNVRNVVVGTFIKFLQLFTIHVASSLWFETKESEDDASKEKTHTGKGTTTSDKQVRQFLMINSNSLLKGDEKIGGQFYDGMNEFYDAIVTEDDKRKSANKVKRAENLVKKAGEKDDKERKAVDATTSASEDDEQPESPKKPVVKETDPEPIALTAAPAAGARRRRNPTK